MNHFRTLVSTKAKRLAIAKQITDLASRYGATLICGRPYDETTDLSLALRVGQYCMNVGPNGRTHNTAFVCSWYDFLGGCLFPDDFAASIRGSRNEVHKAKATACPETIEALLASIEGGLESLIANGLIAPPTPEKAQPQPGAVAT